MNETYSISALAALCGLDRRTTTARLTGIAPVSVKAREKRYTLRDALLGLVRVPDSREGSESESRRLLNDARRTLVELEAETLRKERVPLDDVSAINEAALFAVAGILKSRLGKMFDDETLRDCFTELRGIGERIRELGPNGSDIAAKS